MLKKDNISFKNKLLSHRGRNFLYLENSLKSFSYILNKGIRFIEIDIRVSKDNKFYLLHDPFFYIGNKKYKISNLNNININGLDLLNDILLYFSKNKKFGQIIAIDIKDYGYEKELYETFEKYNILDSVIIFTWIPQTIFAFDKIFSSGKKEFPLYLSHVRTDSFLKFLGIPFILGLFKKFIVVKDFVLIGNGTYKKKLGKYAKGYRHISYFTKLPNDLIEILKKYNGGICVTKSFDFKDGLLKKYYKLGLKVTLFGAIFGLIKIKNKQTFLHEAKKYYLDIVFMDDVENIIS